MVQIFVDRTGIDELLDVISRELSIHEDVGMCASCRSGWNEKILDAIATKEFRDYIQHHVRIGRNFRWAQELA